MRLLAAAAFLAASMVVTPAFAQAGMGMSNPPTRRVGELNQLSPTHLHWQACRGEDARAAIRGCGRVIGARVSRVHTAAAHYFRSVAYQSLGQNERALRDLRRAYLTFGDLLFEEQDNEVARYGRGLSLIRMGRQAEGEQEIALAVSASEGEAEHFFEIDG